MNKKLTKFLAGLFLSGITFAQNDNQPYFYYSAGGDAQSFPYKYGMYDVDKDGTSDQVYFRYSFTEKKYELRFTAGVKDNQFGMGETNINTMMDSPIFVTQSNSSLLTIDADNDGQNDLVFVNGDTFDVYKLKYNNGKYIPSKIIDGADLKYNSSGTDYSSVQKLLGGNFTNDNRMDIVIGNYENKLFLATQNADGSFTKTAITSGNHTINDAKVLDYNNDGKLDIVTLTSEPNDKLVKVVLFAGDGNGNFTESTLINYQANTGYWGASNNGNTLIIEDLNNDQKWDIAIAGMQNTVLAYLNNGDKTFTEKLLNDESRSIYSTMIDGQKAVLVATEVNSIFKIKAYTFVGNVVTEKVIFEKDVTNSGIIDWYAKDYDNDGKFDFLLSRNSYPYYYTTNSPKHTNFGNQTSATIRLDFLGNLSQSFKVTISNENEATLTVNANSGATVTGDGTTSVMVEGTYAQIVKALGGITYNGKYKGKQYMDIKVESNGKTTTYPAWVELNSTSLQEKLTITSNPLMDKELCEGQETTFSVSATSTSTLSYEWQVEVQGTFVAIDETPFTMGTKTATLKIIAGKSLQGAKIRCKISDAKSTANSNVAMLTVNAMPMVKLGGDLTFYKNAANSMLDAGSGFASYTWNGQAGTSTFEINPTTLPVGNNQIIAVVTSDKGCVGADTINILIKEPITLIQSNNALTNQAYFRYSGGGTQNYPYRYTNYDIDNDGKIDNVYFKYNNSVQKREIVYNTFRDGKVFDEGKKLNDMLATPLYFTKGGITTTFDVNNDNKENFVFVNGDDFKIYYLNNKEVMLLLDASDLIFNSGGTNYSAIAYIKNGDFNKDNKQDFIIATTENKLFLATQNGDGSFTRKALSTENLSSKGLAIVDYDGDTNLDVVNLSSESNNENVFVHLFKNDGQGNFTQSTLVNFVASTKYWASTNNARTLIVEDLNGDSKKDIAIAGNAQGVRIYINTGSSLLEKVLLDETQNNKSIFVADLNNNGKKELLSVTGDNANFTIKAFEFDGDVITESRLYAQDVTNLGVIDWMVDDFGQDGSTDFLLSQNSYDYYYSVTSPKHTSTTPSVFVRTTLFGYAGQKNLKVTLSNQHEATIETTATNITATVTGDKSTSVTIEGTYEEVNRVLTSMKYTAKFKGEQFMDIEVMNGTETFTNKAWIDLNSTLLEDKFEITSMLKDTTVCEGTQLMFKTMATGKGTFTYQWQIEQNGQFVNIPDSPFSTGTKTADLSIIAAQSLQGKIRCQVSNGTTTITSNTATITVNAAPVVNLGPDKTITSTDIITLDAGNGFTSYLWNTGAKTQTIEVKNLTKATQYVVSVTNASNCMNVDTININVKEGFVVFKDANFKNYFLAPEFDLNKDGEIQFSEALNIKAINVAGLDIVDMAGIEHFKNLEDLNCSRNGLVSLDLSNNPNLTKLSAELNTIKILNVSKNTNLTYVKCFGNNLSNLDITKNTELDYLDCSRNNLTTLDLSQNTKLTNLRALTNSLSSLDVSKNTNLTYLSLADNQLTTLDVSKNVNLTNLYCGTNQLTALDIANNLELSILNIFNNQITAIDVTKHVKLVNFDCSKNLLTSLNISNNTLLEVFKCNNNNLTALEVGNSPKLTTLNCSNNKLTTLDVSKNTKLKSLNYSNNPITNLVKPNARVASNVVDFSFLPELNVLFCANTNLTGIDVSQNLLLDSLDCSNNQLTDLDVSKNTKLTYLYCFGNVNLPKIYVNSVSYALSNNEFKKDAAAEWVEPIVTSTTSTTSSKATVVKAYDLQGKEVPVDTKGNFIILLYSDGHVEKAFQE